jgi:CubicO group peptidase (beta-lactamase class C family)
MTLRRVVSFHGHGRRWHARGAWCGVYGNHFFVDPAQKVTVIVLTNTALAGMTDAFPDALLEAVYGRRTQ